MFKKLEAVGIMVRNLDEALERYTQAFGLHKVPIQDFPHDGVKGARVPIGEAILDLMEPTDPQGPVGRSLEKRGEGVFLITVSVDSLEETCRHLEAMGARLIEGQVPPDSSFRHVFVHPHFANGVLIEMVEAH